MYTEGKWEACQTPLGGHGLMIDKRLVADIRTDCPDDAQLIAAAPDLYRALKTITSKMSPPDDMLCYLPELVKAREALAKAEGR